MRASKNLQRLASLVLAGAVALATVGSLVACGGGDRVEPFVPTRLIVFGDENSFMRSSNGTTTAPAQDDGSSPAGLPGRRYTINLYLPNAGSGNIQHVCDSTYTLTWFQLLAFRYGMLFTGCAYNADPGTSIAAQTWATESATASSIVTSINNFIATNGNFREGDLVTVMAGTNDIIAAYTLYPAGLTRTAQLGALRTQMRAAGRQLSNKINAIQQTGAHVLLFTTPDLGLSPYSKARGTLVTDIASTSMDCEDTPTSEQQWLSVLTDCFNLGLRASPGLQGAGKRVALVRVDSLTRQVAADPGAYELANATDMACNAALPACSVHDTGIDGVPDAPGDLVTLAALSTYFWADDLRLAPAAHSLIANLAISQARNNWE